MAGREIWTSAAEVARFAIALMNDGKLGGVQALPAGLFAQLSKGRAEVPAIEEQYGYGLALGRYRGLSRLGHGGTMPGFAVQLHAAEAAKPQPQVAGGQPVKVALPPGVDRYLGSYTNPRRWTLEITKNDRQPVLKQFGCEFPIEMVDEDRFLFRLPGRERPVLLVIGPRGHEGASYAQFYVWTFVRVKG